MEQESRRPGEGSGSECSMAENAPSHTRKARDPQFIGPRFAGESEAKIALRHRIHRAHAAAVSRAERANSGYAHEFLWRAAQIAGDWQFTRATEEQLQDALIGLTGLFVAANAFERAATDVD